jgi:hypothetical protein
LKKLDFYGNLLTKLDNLQPNLKKLECFDNQFVYDFEVTLENIRNYNSSIK